MNADRRWARCGSGSSSCGSFGALSTTKSGVRVAAFAAVLGAVFGAGAGVGLGAGVTAAGAGAGVGFGSPIGWTDVPKYGDTSSGSPVSA